jgi:glutathione synthase
VNRVLFVVDPLAALQADVDASIGLMAATQDLGCDVWVCEPEDLAVASGRVRADARQLMLAPRRRGEDHRWRVADPWYEVVASRLLDVADEVDLTMLRIDPPVDARYLHTTYLLDLVETCGGRVANRPAGIRALHEKLVALRFPHLCPETVVTCDPTAVRGIAVAGLDVIGGRLIEVNVTCPGGMHKADALLGTDISGVTMRRLLLRERVPAATVHRR